MDFTHTTDGSAPILRRYDIGATISRLGVPLVIPAAGQAGIVPGTTTAANGFVGVSLETGTFATAQNADGSDPAVSTTVNINPNSVFRAKLSGTAVSGGALVIETEDTGSTTGLVVTTGTNFTSPTMDEGVIWGLTGNNTGIVRKITSVGVTAVTVTIAFPNDIAIGDTFAVGNFHLLDTQSVTLTTELDEINTTAAVSASAAEFIVTQGIFEGTTDSFIDIKPRDHALANR